MNSVPPAVFPFEALANWPVHGTALTPPARLAVIGDPIAHSKSPQMHNPALLAAGMDAQYVRVQVPVGKVAEALEGFKAAGFWGINVTIPHKEKAFDLVTAADETTERLRAVNTVFVRDGKRYGTNTDGEGFINSLQQSVPGHSLKNSRAVVLGAGGAALAVAGR